MSGQILEVCYKSGVQVVTIYAFSIENYKRPKFEVDALMDMAKIKLSQICQHGELLQRYGAKIQILGQMDLVRPDVIETMNEAVEMTKDNGLYVCQYYLLRREADYKQRRTERLLLIHITRRDHNRDSRDCSRFFPSFATDNKKAVLRDTH